MHSNNISTTTTTTTVTLTATTAIIIYNTVIISGRFYPLDECQAAQSERVSFAVNSDCTASQPVVSRSPLFRFRRPHQIASMKPIEEAPPTRCNRRWRTPPGDEWVRKAISARCHCCASYRRGCLIRFLLSYSVQLLNSPILS